jgi:hypothetical protein
MIHCAKAASTGVLNGKISVPTEVTGFSLDARPSTQLALSLSKCPSLAQDADYSGMTAKCSPQMVSFPRSLLLLEGHERCEVSFLEGVNPRSAAADRGLPQYGILPERPVLQRFRGGRRRGARTMGEETSPIHFRAFAISKGMGVCRDFRSLAISSFRRRWGRCGDFRAFALSKGMGAAVGNFVFSYSRIFEGGGGGVGMFVLSSSRRREVVFPCKEIMRVIICL